MHIIGKFLLIIIYLFLTNCKNNLEDSQNVEIIDIEGSLDKMEVWNLSQFASSIRYVALETSNENYLSYIQDYLELDQDIIVKNLSQCFLFDNEGKFVKQIGKRGRGPGEFQFVVNMGIVNDSVLAIQSLFDVINYATDGSFINQEKNFFRFNDSNDEYFQSWIILNDSLFFGHVPNTTGLIPNKALIFDQQRKIIKSYKNYILFKRERTVASGYEDFAHILKFNKYIFYKELYNDTVFVLDDNYNLIPKYITNLGKFKEPITDRAKTLIQVNNMAEYLYIWEVFQTKKNLFISCQMGNHFPAKRLTPKNINLPDGRVVPMNFNTNKALGVFEKKSKKFTFSKPTSTDNSLFTSGLYNDLDGGPRFFPTKQVNDSTMLMWIKAEDFLNHISSEDFKNSLPKNPEKKKQLEELAGRISMFDNPILMYVTFN